MTSRNQSHYLTSRHLITNHITSSHHAANHMTSYHITSQHITSPPTHHWNTTSHHTRRNGWRLLHAKNSIWASHWLVALRTFYRQILSVNYRSFSPWNFRPRLTRELLQTGSNKVHSHGARRSLFVLQLLRLKRSWLCEISFATNCQSSIMNRKPNKLKYHWWDLTLEKLLSPWQLFGHIFPEALCCHPARGGNSCR